MGILQKIRDSFITEKLYFARATSYISLLTMAGTYYLVAKENDISILIYIILLVLVMIFFHFIGYFDTKFNFWKIEQKKSQEQNPKIIEILEKLDEIQKRLNDNTTK